RGQNRGVVSWLSDFSRPLSNPSASVWPYSRNSSPSSAPASPRVISRLIASRSRLARSRREVVAGLVINSVRCRRGASKIVVSRPFREGRDQHVAETMAPVEIVPIAQDHIESFHRSLDFVARERRYLSFLEAPPFESVRAFVLDNIKQGYPQLVAVSAGQVVGWCDVVPTPRPIYAHGGVLGMGLLPEFRGQRLGDRLIR